MRRLQKKKKNKAKQNKTKPHPKQTNKQNNNNNKKPRIAPFNASSSSSCTNTIYKPVVTLSIEFRTEDVCSDTSLSETLSVFVCLCLSVSVCVSVCVCLCCMHAFRLLTDVNCLGVVRTSFPSPPGEDRTWQQPHVTVIISQQPHVTVIISPS